MGWNLKRSPVEGCLSEYDKGYRDGSKETAEKILRKLKERVRTRYTLLGSHTCYGDIEFEIDNLADEIGVGIKE
jgi:hypothetical protein